MQDLESRSEAMRSDIIAMIAEAGSGHPGGSLSCIDILNALYLGGVMDHDPKDPCKRSRDRFVLAKGHAAPALYVALAHSGYFPREELASLRKVGSRLQGHPDSNLLPGVEVSTGSLGQGLSIACGMAAGMRIEGTDATVFVLLGDGECEEGQVWEAAMFAANQRLDNIVAIVDSNGLQIDGDVDDVAGVGDLAAKFEAFGWKAERVDGHDVSALSSVLEEAKSARDGMPVVVVADTVKGKGVSFMENQAGWHGKAPSKDQALQALTEIGDCDTSMFGILEGGE